MHGAAKQSGNRVVMGLVMGDPAGIGAEITAKALSDGTLPDDIQLVVLGSQRVLEDAARLCGLSVNLPVLPLAGLTREKIISMDRHVFVESGADRALATITPGHASASAGTFALDNFRLGIDLANNGIFDALSFAPFNKYAMRLAYPSYQDEIVFISEVLGEHDAAAEFNIGDIWTGRVTSHVPLSEVAGLITREAVVRRLVLTDRIMRAGGVTEPNIAVAGLNPHAGDGGNFGREEIDVIGPAVEEGRRLGIHCDGPYPPDTVFIRAKRGEFNAVLTMYHDQGQIAMKLMHFERGVVLFGGFPFPVCTPAHGTAYDIAGKGTAHPGAMRATLALAASLARGGMQARQDRAQNPSTAVASEAMG